MYNTQQLQQFLVLVEFPRRVPQHFFVRISCRLQAALAKATQLSKQAAKSVKTKKQEIDKSADVVDLQVCVCVCERERERVCARVCVCACMCTSVRL